MKRFIAAAALLMPMAIAQASEMPRYDAEAHCEQVAGFGGEFSNTMYNSCVDMEQGAYNNIKGQWASLPGSVQSHCDQVASFGGSGSYTMLESCVDMEVSAGKKKSQFSFD